MANQVESSLLPELIEELQKQRLVTIATVDYETGGPNVNTISWVHAKDKHTINFIVNGKSRIVKNIKNNQNVVIYVIIGKSAYSISGKSVILEEKLPRFPLKLSLMEMDIKEVRDVMFYGANIVEEPKFTHTYDDVAANKLNDQIQAALKEN